MIQVDHTHDPALTSWVDSANGHPDFPIQNLPLGVFSRRGEEPRIGVAIGDRILDCRMLATGDLLDDHMRLALTLPHLNAWFAHGHRHGQALRHCLSDLLSDERHRAAVEPMLVSQAAVEMHLPCTIGDYTDFYVGIHHATNVGKQFRPDQPLLPNYKYVPIGYHGRASSVRLSGTPVVRPKGQRKPPTADVPDYGPSRRLDYELELGIFIGRGNELGETISIGEAGEHIAGYCLLNDWSARDLQAWEYQPLGPFLAKNFQTSISPWVVTPQALAPFRRAMGARPEGDPSPLPYLDHADDRQGGALGIELEVTLLTAAMREAGTKPHVLSRGEAAAAMYWSAAQIVTHHASNGCNLQPGDLIGTGTLSVEDSSGLGSLLEISQGGKAPLTLPSGEQRSFLEDGDELTLAARCVGEGAATIGFGTCTGRICPAN
ncbi:fumarylacetoacetase [Sphingomonas sp. LY160]|uniref:fumarylacetoacetase n=1 Tax=Sphingomonas sp. LY160 TaxID=3095342 RepID=UPI002ADEA97A|nr:fumarylacetoacetase [Sphingomonas sp. LY160]MEA1072672.1 fumarylacetoacetase [Sphingomonas sp. LY160]